MVVNITMFDFLMENHSLYDLFKLHWLLFVGIAIYFYNKKVLRSPVFQVSSRQKVYFYIAISLFSILKVTPIDVIATHYLFSAHVLQTSILLFIITPLLIISLPMEFFRKYAWNHRTKLFITILAHPWLTLVLFNGLLSVFLIPVVFNIIHSSAILSFIANLILFIHAFFMWWVIIQPLPELKNFSYIIRAAYIFFASVALFPIGFYFIIAGQPLFSTYSAVSGEFIPALTVVYDQQLGGGLLKIIQTFTYAYALLIIMFQWAKEEQKMEGQSGEKHIRYARGVVIHLDKDKNK